MLSSEGQATEAPAGREGKANESLAWFPWILGCTSRCVSVLGSAREKMPLCCVKGGKLCPRSAFRFCSEVFICVIAGEGSLGGAGKQPGLPSPNNCRRSHQENFPCDMKRCRAQGVCPGVPLCTGHTWPRENRGAPWGCPGPRCQETPPDAMWERGAWLAGPAAPRSPRHAHRVCRAHT